MSGLSVALIVQSAALLLAVGATLVTALFLLPGKRHVAAEIFAATLSMSVVVATMMAVFWSGAYGLVPFMLLLAGRCTYEAATVLFDRRTGLWAGAGAALVTGLAMLVPATTGVTVALVTAALSGLWLLVFGRRIMGRRIMGRRIMGRGAGAAPHRDPGALVLYPVLPVAVLAAAVLDPDLRPVMLLIYVLVELFDSCAYAVGKLFGRTPAFPVLSPRKTVEGLVGGGVCLMGIAAGVAFWAGYPVPGAVLLALLAGLFGVAGDLGASRLKRTAGVKDFPVVLKQQGGALDVLDSWISAAAAIAVAILLSDLL